MNNNNNYNFNYSYNFYRFVIKLIFFFLLKKAGDYQINVKWSGEHVPNSPFNVKIFKTNEELLNFLKDNQEQFTQSGAYDYLLNNTYETLND
jgi:hypothetical protein